MKSLNQVILALFVASLISSTCAAPAQKPTGKRVSLTRAFTPGHTVLDASGQALVLKSNALGYQYLGEIQIVDNQTNFHKANVIFDSGSSDLWIRESKACVKSDTWLCDLSTVFCSETCYYGHSEGAFDDEYGLGYAKGDIYNTSVLVGELGSYVNFGLSTNTSKYMNGQDGIFGTAFANISVIANKTGDTKAAIDYILEDAGSNTISYFLDRTNDCSEVVIGGSNPNLYNTARKHDIALTHELWWTFELHSMSFGDYKNTTSVQVISDTGTSLLYLPSEMVARIIKEMSIEEVYQGYYVVKCSGDHPTLTLSLTTTSGEHVPFDLGSEHYLLNKNTYNKEANLATSAEDDDKCLVLLVDGGTKAPFILGDVFIHAYYQMYTKDASYPNGGYITMAPVVKPSDCS